MVEDILFGSWEFSVHDGRVIVQDAPNRVLSSAYALSVYGVRSMVLCSPRVVESVCERLSDAARAAAAYLGRPDADREAYRNWVLERTRRAEALTRSLWLRLSSLYENRKQERESVSRDDESADNGAVVRAKDVERVRERARNALRFHAEVKAMSDGDAVEYPVVGGGVIYCENVPQKIAISCFEIAKYGPYSQVVFFQPDMADLFKALIRLGENYSEVLAKRFYLGMNMDDFRPYHEFLDALVRDALDLQDRMMALLSQSGVPVPGGIRRRRKMLDKAAIAKKKEASNG
ncbi:MAG: hypothetical protein D6771_03205 [Zetaproteobacteria bacterium]|nr:MAG: hypothetical protein D6771_03205 [Zetaproteobacteria bacterium]